VELVVGMMLAVVVIGLAGGLIIYGSSFLTHTEVRAEEKQLAEDGADYIRDRLFNARSIEVVRADEPPLGSGGSRGGELIFIGEKDGDGTVRLASSGSLYYLGAGETEPLDVLGSAYYTNSTLALSYQAIVTTGTSPARPEKSFRIILKTIHDGSVVYDSPKTFSLYEALASSEPLQNFAISTWGSEDGFDTAALSNAPTLDATFYLLISPSSDGYVEDGLVAHFDAVDNVRGLGSNAQIHHDSGQRTLWSDLSGNGNDMRLLFTDNANPIRNQTIYFDGAGDYGVIDTLDLSPYQAVTVEVCFREEDTERPACFLSTRLSGTTSQPVLVSVSIPGPLAYPKITPAT
jgi:hypothetical protein